MDLCGGTGVPTTCVEEKEVDEGEGPDGKAIKPFTYVWQHERFNPVTHDILCHIHFDFPDGSRIEKAFTYDWRLWTIPELHEVLAEAGFAGTDLYTHGWGKDGESDEIYRSRKRFDNEEGWLAYVVGYRDSE